MYCVINPKIIKIRTFTQKPSQFYNNNKSKGTPPNVINIVENHRSRSISKDERIVTKQWIKKVGIPTFLKISLQMLKVPFKIDPLCPKDWLRKTLETKLQVKIVKNSKMVENRNKGISIIKRLRKSSIKMNRLPKMISKVNNVLKKGNNFLTTKHKRKYMFPTQMLINYTVCYKFISKGCIPPF